MLLISCCRISLSAYFTLLHEKILDKYQSSVIGEKKSLLASEELESGKGSTEPRPVSYSYSFFHLIFALASMYSAMLLSGWTSSSESSDLIDVGWTSLWVRICTEWVTAGLYIWSLVAPLLFPDREFYWSLYNDQYVVICLVIMCLFNLYQALLCKYKMSMLLYLSTIKCSSNLYLALLVYGTCLKLNPE